MRVGWGLERTYSRPSCLALGVFDGVHLGHCRVISTAVRQARANGIVPAVLTFEPHPAAVVSPAGAPPLLTTTEEKIALLRELGVELVVVAPFDRVLARMAPEAFISEVLVRRLRARCVVVGADWRFGSGGRGNAELLKKIAPRYGCGATIVSPVSVAGKPVSSTRIRKLLMRGDAGGASALLGRWYTLQGVVVRGDGLGRQLGFPTANLQLPAEKLIPADGVYACWAHSGAMPRARGRAWPALCYIGVRPTVERGGPRRVEVHLLERRGTVGALGSVLRAELARRLRPDRRFPSTEALVAQMAFDCLRARPVLALHAR